MKVGNLVKCIHTGEMCVITYVRKRGKCDYVEINGKWIVPKEQLEVVSESR